MPSLNREIGMFYHVPPPPTRNERQQCSWPVIFAAYLTQTLLSGPHRRVDYLEEKLPCAWVEDEDGPIDGFGCQVPLKGLKNKCIS